MFPFGVEAAQESRQAGCSSAIMHALTLSSDMYRSVPGFTCLHFQVQGLNTREELLQAMDDDPWHDANIPEVLDYLELNTRLHAPLASQVEAAILS